MTVGYSRFDPLDEAEDDEELFKNEIVIEFKKDDQAWKKKIQNLKKIFNTPINALPLIISAPLTISTPKKGQIS